MKKVSITSSIIFILLFSAAYAELSERAFSFSGLLSNSDIIAKGKVISVSSEPYKQIINFQVEQYVKGRISENPIQINVPLAGGLRIPNEPYLEINGTYLLFLQQNENIFTITNKIAGVFSPDQESDVLTLFEAYQNNNEIFSAGYSAPLQDLFLLTANDNTKIRLLHDLKRHQTSSDSTFISSLLKSDNTNHKVFAILQSGRLQIESLRLDIENLLQNDGNYNVKFHSIVSLGDYGKSESLNLILENLSDSDPSIRRAAVHAAGKIGGNKIVEPLRKQYPSESDMGQRLSIIEAINRLPDRSIATDVMQYFLSIESNALLVSILEKNVSP